MKRNWELELIRGSGKVRKRTGSERSGRMDLLEVARTSRGGGEQGWKREEEKGETDIRRECLARDYRDEQCVPNRFVGEDLGEGRRSKEGRGMWCRDRGCEGNRTGREHGR